MTRRDPWLIGGLLVVWAAAMIASFSTLAGLAAAAGWHGRSAWLLPLCLDALGMSAGRVWMNPKAPGSARSYARVVTLAAVVLSVLGNAAGHMVTTGYVVPGLVLVVLVGAVPPASIAAVVHLAVLVWSPVPGRRTREQVVPQPPVEQKPAEHVDKPKPARKPSAKAEPVSDEVLYQRAKHVAEAYERERGKPISRDALKKELGVSSGRASAVHAKLKAEAEVA
jgi:hypothetical protein